MQLNQHRNLSKLPNQQQTKPVGQSHLINVLHFSTQTPFYNQSVTVEKSKTLKNSWARWVLGWLKKALASPSSTIAPFSKNKTRSATALANCNSWVTIIMVYPS